MPTEASHAMVASANATASRVGRDLLQLGGNAVDAAVGVALTLAVTYPRAGNLGGGGFMVIALPDGRTTVIDYRETAPAKATHDMYLGPDGKVVPGLSLSGYKASGVPGTVAGLELAWKKYGSGKLTWAELVEPALKLARDGFPLPPGLAGDLRAEAKALSRFAETKRVYLKNGDILAVGATYRLPDLADTLERLAHHGAREFYEGETARRIVDDMAKNGGLITAEDLRRYRAVERPALIGQYRGYEIITVPPPSSGGVALLQMLAMLEPHDPATLGHASAAKYHLYAEVMRRAYRDRAAYLGDPDFISVPVTRLIDSRYAQHLMDNYDPAHATPSATLPPGNPTGASAPRTGEPASHAPSEPTETTHFSVVDASGSAVANTYTLNGFFGSGVTVTGTGILMNNEMDDFAAAPGAPNLFGLVQGEANAIAPGKRPLSSMTPTIVRKESRVYLVTGSPGGSTIPNTVLFVVTGVIDEHMAITQAVEQPRVHHQWLPDQITYEPDGLSTDVVAALEAKGHVVAKRNVYGGDPRVTRYRYYWGDAESILVDPATRLRLGAIDPRSPDAGALGY